MEYDMVNVIDDLVGNVLESCEKHLECIIVQQWISFLDDGVRIIVKALSRNLIDVFELITILV